MANRIKELRKKKGWSQQKLAEVVGTSNQQIGYLERAQRSLKQTWMVKLARALDVSPAELLPIETPPLALPLLGTVQAGVWRVPTEDEPEWISLPIPEVYMRLRAFALRVAGTSMNLIFPEGTILICCHMEELNEDPRPGKRYIIEDVDPHGEIETTVKEYQVDDDGRPWAWPRSTDPQWQQPVPLDNGRDGHTITLKARVVFALRPE